MGRRAPTVLLVLLLAAASCVVAYNVLWAVSSAPNPGIDSRSTPSQPAKSRVLPDRTRATAPTAGAPVARVIANSVATPAGASAPPAQTPTYGVVKLLADGVGFYLGDPAHGGVLNIKRTLAVSQLDPKEVERLRAGVRVGSQAEALSLLEGLTGSAD